MNEMKPNDMVSLKNVNITLGEFSLTDINFNIKKGEHFVILGPSGNGKTVLVKSIAGFLKISSGEIWIDGTRKDKCPPEERGIGFVFQDHVLFPHMSVFDNIAFSLKLEKMNKSDIKKKVENISKTLHIKNLLGRTIVNLSGGERQRVALARSVIHAPDLLIMDEPYASMDKNMADELIIEEKNLQKKINQTTIHITHNHEEAVTLADRVCIMDNGKIRMIGTPDEVFRRPNSTFIANFLCTENVYENAFLKNGEKDSLITYREKKLHCHKNGKKGKVAFCIRPGDIAMSVEHPGQHKNVFKGSVVGIYNKGEMFRCVVDVGFELIIKIPRKNFMALNVNQGDVIYAAISEDNIHVI